VTDRPWPSFVADLGEIPERCPCSAPCRLESGLVVCERGHVCSVAALKALPQGPLVTWFEFMARVRERLAQGDREYGDRSFARPAHELAGEIEEELFDTAAWSFIAWMRVRRLRAELARLEAAGSNGSGDGAARPEEGATR